MLLEINKIYNMDCLKGMDLMIEQGIKVDAVITDIPQEITRNEWDMAIPFKDMWDKLYKVRKDKTTPIILFTNQPFTSLLICSNLKHFRVMKYWQKDRPSGFLNAKKIPLKDIEEIAIFSEDLNDTLIEEIAIFYEKQCYYNPQMIEGQQNHGIGKVVGEIAYNGKSNNNYGDFKRVTTKGNLKYPRQLMKYPRPHPPIHPTQKPVELIEDLLETYTKEGDLVLDFTIGSGTTAVACKRRNRNYIGFEINEDYFKLANKQINLIQE